MTIRVVDTPENAAPQLPDVEARVLSGGTVQVVPPLEGTDPDGDLVTLDAVATAPTKGTVEIVDGALQYTAAADAVGVDTFGYRVTDTRGASAVGTVRVGIAPTATTNQPPVAVDDGTHVRPGRAVAVDAAANDSDPDGDPIGLVPGSLEGGEPLEAEVVDGVVRMTTPGEAGVHTFYYGVEDTYAARATGAVTVEVDPDAPLLRPVARDDVVPQGSVDGDTVTVDVLRNDSDPDGVASQLEVSVDAAAEEAGVTVADDGAVTVPLTGSPQVLTYTVTDVDGQTARAFLRVPRDGQGPRLRSPLPPLEVVSGEPLTLDLTELVVVAEGRRPRLTAEDRVTAVSGQREVQDATTVVFTSADDFVGAASVNFEVSDATGQDDPDARVATLSVPITVVAAENLPPELTGTPAVEVAAGEEAGVDVARFVDDPDGDPVTVRVAGSVDGLSTSVQGTRVTVRADASLPRGSEISVPVSVADADHPPVEGRVAVTVVGSTRPLVRATDDVVEDAHQGEPVSVPVLRNDSNPFPDEDLVLVGAARETGAGTVAVDGDELVVTPADDFVGVLVARYRVQDATGDPEREVEGRVQVTVLGRPETPRALQVQEVRSQTVVLTWDPPADNGAPITGYTVRANDGRTQDCASTTCTVTGLTNDVTYTFTLTATNDVGDSDASPASPEARPDQRPDQPDAPTLEFGDGSLAVSWTNRTYSDRSPIECVNLEISPAPPSGAIQKPCVTGTSTRWSGLTNGVAYTVRVQAVNGAPDPSDWSVPSAPMVPAGPPERPGAPRATRTDTVLGGVAQVTWSAPDGNGDGPTRYHVTTVRDGQSVATDTVTGTTFEARDLDPGASYAFVVVAENKAGRSPASPASAAVVPYGTPATPTGASAAVDPATPSGRVIVSWSRLAAADLRGPDGYYQVRTAGGEWKTGDQATTDSGRFVYTGLSNGTRYTFQVRACNQYRCGPAADTNAATPYTTPDRPGVSYSRTGEQTGRFTVRAGGDGGESVDRLEYRLNGGGWQRTGGTVDVGPAWATTYTLEARACNAAGCGPSQSASGRTDPDPATRTMTITKGASSDKGTADDGCYTETYGPDVQDCHYLHLELRNGTPSTTVTYTCWTTDDYWGRAESPRQYAGPYTFRTDGNGSFSGDLTCQHTYVGESTWIVATSPAWGESNHAPW